MQLSYGKLGGCGKINIVGCDGREEVIVEVIHGSSGGIDDTNEGAVAGGGVSFQDLPCCVLALVRGSLIY